MWQEGQGGVGSEGHAPVLVGAGKGAVVAVATKKRKRKPPATHMPGATTAAHLASRIY
jgi:hypothetical protein